MTEQLSPSIIQEYIEGPEVCNDLWAIISIDEILVALFEPVSFFKLLFRLQYANQLVL